MFKKDCLYLCYCTVLMIKSLFSTQSNACIVWRRFANLFETSQSLFWASFGLVSLTDFELTGIKEFTRFWALLMFGSYSVCNIIVLLNMLIAMMSNSFQVSLKFWDPNHLLHWGKISIKTKLMEIFEFSGCLNGTFP